MRIAMTVRWMAPGGIETLLLRLGAFLSQQPGIEVEIVTTILKGRWFDRIAEYHLTGHHISGFDWNIPVLHAQKIARWLKQRNFDVVITNYDRMTQAILAQLPDSTAVISAIHNDAETVYKVSCGNANAINVILGVSPLVREKARLRLPGRPVVCIPNGVDLPGIDQYAGRAPFQFPLRLLVVGRLSRAGKGVLLLPEILRGCVERGVDVSLTLIGDGEDRPALEKAFKTAGVAERVEFCGHLPPSAVYKNYLSSHLLLFLSPSEGFGIVLAEAMACGCIPVSSRLEGVTDYIITHGETGILVETGDKTGYIDAIVQMANDGERWTRMSHAAHTDAEKRFSIAATGNAYLQLIRDIKDGVYPLPQSRSQLQSLCREVLSSRDYSPEFLRSCERKIVQFYERTIRRNPRSTESTFVWR